MSKETGREKAVNPDDKIKILIATDIHLGYDFNKKRGQESEDSFTTFEEILQYGKDHEVDFVLLGGDLFHDTKPSQTAMLKCMELLRKYCLGSREIKVEFLSDPQVVFRHCAYKTVNYEDPSLNISMPVFTIHGNHDDPSFGAVGSMDLLSASGLINYFGKWTDLTHITIPPLIMRKGETHVALYGLSYINDQRLSRLLRDYKVDLLRPKEIPDCFNILVLHQNRAQHSEYGHIPQHKLPDFLNFVIWGHEHECRITPEFVPEAEYFISQPGSSIATSLCEGEAKPKHVGILTIYKQKFHLKKLQLRTVRPFVFENLILQDHEIQRNYTETLSDSVCNFVDTYIENELIPKASRQLSGHPKQPIHPLLRLRVFHDSAEEVFDTMKLAQKYCDEIANPMDMIVFRKQQKSVNRNSRSTLLDPDDELREMAQIFSYDDDERDWRRTVQGGIKKYFSLEENKDKLTVLTVNGLNEALNRFVDRGDPDAFKDIVKHQMKKTIAHLETCNVNTTEKICEEIKNFRNMRMEKDQEEQTEIQKTFGSTRSTSMASLDEDTGENIDVDSDEFDEINVPPIIQKTRGRGTARGRGSRGGGRGRGKTTAKNLGEITTVSRPTKTTDTKRKPRKQVQASLQGFMSRSNTTITETYLTDDSD